MLLVPATMSASFTLQSLLDEGVRTGVFSAAQAHVVHDGRSVFAGQTGEASAQTLFDLASVTKVATTLLFLALESRGLAGNTRLQAILPTASTQDATLEDLLFHRSGLPAWRPFFAHPDALPALLHSRSPELVERAHRVVVEGALACVPERPVGERAVYSDVGFILLGEALAQAAGEPLDLLFARTLSRPLNLALTYRRLDAPPRGDDCAPTGTTRPRPLPPGLWAPLSIPPTPSRRGEVDDDNAWAMGGVAGHAGLFATAHTLARLGQLVLEDIEGARRLAPPERWQTVVRRDARTPGSERALGFDTVSPGASSTGRHLSAHAIGHLGFTGTSLWIDPVARLVVSLVTNRSLLSRTPEPMRSFRPRFHDLAYEFACGMG